MESFPKLMASNNSNLKFNGREEVCKILYVEDYEQYEALEEIDDCSFASEYNFNEEMQDISSSPKSKTVEYELLGNLK